MANGYNGEINIWLDYKEYPMRINMNVIAAFQSETGKDFMQVAIKAMNSLRRTVNLEPMDQSELMTSAVSMEDAARLFYLAAKEMDKSVTFDEMQEAVLNEGPLAQIDDDGNIIQSYPVIFANLVMFAILGVQDTAKKT